ncbi:hypothetical protein JW992_16610 [candidate division KSB1 bacterium]|nr:hypothetical protein [candidate division KSB1 bacterium]
MNGGSLQGRRLYIPQMSYEGARCMAAAFQSMGIDALPSPAGDAETYKLARQYLSGDECLPEAVTLGNFLKVTRQPDYRPETTAFLLPTSNGPCRFGHYLPLAKKIFSERGEPVLIFSPSSAGGYEDIGAGARDLVRTAWRAVVVSDILRKLLLWYRPLERHAGDSDRIYHQILDAVCQALALRDVGHRKRLHAVRAALIEAKHAFNAIAIDKQRPLLLIGVVGEIFCRLNTFSNDELVREIEAQGGRVWLSDVAEWVWYTNDEEIINLKRAGRGLSFAMFGCRIRHAVMHADEHALYSPFTDAFPGMEEPRHTNEILQKSRRYLPREGAHGEMVLSVGKTIWYWEKGADGVIDISPFTCMNGIVCEAVYPRVSRDLNGMPIRLFYFDALQHDWSEEVEMFMELAQAYRRRRDR